MKRKSLLIYKSSHLETSLSYIAFFFLEMKRKLHSSSELIFLLRDVVDVILLLQFFICIYLLILGNENSNNLNISLP